MRGYRYDHVHLRSADPDATARFFATMFGTEVTRDVYAPSPRSPGAPQRDDLAQRPG
jgi:lactoylglutathione lyase